MTQPSTNRSLRAGLRGRSSAPTLGRRACHTADRAPCRPPSPGRSRRTTHRDPGRAGSRGRRPRWGQGAGLAGACGSPVASHRLVSRRFLLPRQGKSHVQSSDRTGGAALFTFQLRSGQPLARKGIVQRLRKPDRMRRGTVPGRRPRAGPRSAGGLAPGTRRRPRARWRRGGPRAAPRSRDPTRRRWTPCDFGWAVGSILAHPDCCRGPGSCWPWPPRPSAPTRPAAGATSGPPRAVRSARVTILSTMLADTKGIGEWGFAALVEADGHRLLFDTGARPETVLANARELGIDLAERHRRRPQPPPRRPHRRPADAPPRAGEGATPRRCRAPTSARGIFLPRPARRRPRGQRDDRPEGAVRGDRGPLRGGRPARPRSSPAPG